MDEKELAAGLRNEGFQRTYVWQDGPNVFYPDHHHGEQTTHVILSGEMTLILDGQVRTYHVGDRCDVPAGAIHSTRMGPPAAAI